MVKKKIFPEPAKWDFARLRSIVEGWASKKILVVGDVGLDRYTVGLVERISPEAPVPIVTVTERRAKLGLAGNVADNVKALGGEVSLSGVVGTDQSATELEQLLKSAEISSGGIVADPSRPTIMKNRIVSEQQQLMRVDYESNEELGDQTRKEVIARVAEQIESVQAVVLQDYAKGLFCQELAKSVFDLAIKNDKIILVDPCLNRKMSLYHGAEIITPNKKEAEQLSGISIDNDESLIQAGKKILDQTEAQHAVITLGRDGMAVFSAQDQHYDLIPTYARDVFDVSGAGDTVVSVIALALCAGAKIDEAALLANVAAGVVVGKQGTATVTPKELGRYMDRLSV